MTATATAGWFDAAISPVVEPAIRRFHGDLETLHRLTPVERGRLADGLSLVLGDTVGRLTSRVLLLELHAARIGGRLTGPDPASRWDEFIHGCADAAWWAGLDGPYPRLRSRLDAVVANRAGAAFEMAGRLAADRDAGLLPAAELVAVSIGAGDSHDGGRTVAELRLGDERVFYKPRSLAVDVALAAFLDDVRRVMPSLRAAVPKVVDRGPYGWARHVQHLWCADDGELAEFYRGLGHWLAITRLLGGGDLHGENVVAHGRWPTVVDCETVIAPLPDLPPSGLGEANDIAARAVAESVLRVGLLPSRGAALGWRGVDGSAIGGLQGQQPMLRLPIILDPGTDAARMGYRLAEPVAVVTNHPSPQPALAQLWPEVLEGFAELTAHFARLDRERALALLLDRFLDCRIRVVTRATELYAEHQRMLWHPTSVHDEPAAVGRSARLLRAQAANNPGAAADDAVVAAEIAELLDGDIPIFTTTPRDGRLNGPRGVRYGRAENLVDAALHRWRGMDLDLELSAIRASLVGAYLNDGWTPGGAPLAEAPTPADSLDGVRRAVVTGLVRRLIDHAVRGADGTATWIAPVLDLTGWQVQTSTPDAYNGLAGIAVALAGATTEAAAGRTDEVPGAAALLEAVTHSMRLGEDRLARDRADGLPRRPAAPGGYIGIAGQVWAWLVLDDLGCGGGDALDRAVELARLVPQAVDADEMYDMLGGAAGAIVPLLHLARRSRDDTFIDIAVHAARHVAAAAVRSEGGARWPTQRWPRGLGGFAHGSTGIGWALTRLCVATGEHPDLARLAVEAFTHQESLYDPGRAGWLDARELEPHALTAWCHGAGGIGIAAADLLHHTGDERHRDVLRRAAALVWASGMRWNHTLCHGDAGAWELLSAAIDAGVGPDGLDRATLNACVVGGLATHGPVAGLVRDTFTPGLLPGIGGMPYQLLRLDPTCPLPSALLLDVR